MTKVHTCLSGAERCLHLAGLDESRQHRYWDMAIQWLDMAFRYQVIADKAERPMRTVPYDQGGTLAHRDHVHVSFLTQ